jgi:ATP-dependent DNA helicase DinG
MTIASILGPGGAIARRLSAYEARPQQLEMAQAVADAIADQKHLMVEAGTGVGKSFAYLIPAILAAQAGGKDCRVVVSTHTISLQEQLVRKDIPFLQSVLPGEFSACLVKGRSNYLSLRRLRGSQQRAPLLLSEPSTQAQLQQIGRWSRQTQDGSRSDLPFQPLPVVWDLVESDSGNCLGRGCPDYQRCFYFKARKQMFGAQVLVVNHALFCSDLALRRQGASLLPDYQVVILDEAHTLEDVAADHLGLQVGRGSLDYILNKLFSARGRGLLASFGPPEALRQVEATRQAGDRFFDAILAWVARQPRSSGRGQPRPAADDVRVREPDIVPDVLSEELKKLAGCVDAIAKDLDDEVKIEFTAIADRARQLRESVQKWLGQGLEGQVYWIETTTGRGPPRVDLVSAPIGSARRCRRCSIPRCRR